MPFLSGAGSFTSNILCPSGKTIKFGLKEIAHFLSTHKKNLK